MSEKDVPGRGGGMAGGRAGSARERHPAGASREKQEWIGRQLRSVYNQVLDEPLPDQFKELLTKLESKASSEKKGES